MKPKFTIKLTLAPSEKAPGLCCIHSQWRDGGLVTSDDNNGKGWTEEAGLEEIQRRRIKFQLSTQEFQ